MVVRMRLGGTMDALNDLRTLIEALQKLAGEIENSKHPYLLWGRVEQIAFSVVETADEAKKTAPRPQLPL